MALPVGATPFGQAGQYVLGSTIYDSSGKAIGAFSGGGTSGGGLDSVQSGAGKEHMATLQDYIDAANLRRSLPTRARLPVDDNYEMRGNQLWMRNSAGQMEPAFFTYLPGETVNGPDGNQVQLKTHVPVPQSEVGRLQAEVTRMGGTDFAPAADIQSQGFLKDNADILKFAGIVAGANALGSGLAGAGAGSGAGVGLENAIGADVASGAFGATESAALGGAGLDTVANSAASGTTMTAAETAAGAGADLGGAGTTGAGAGAGGAASGAGAGTGAGTAAKVATAATALPKDLYTALTQAGVNIATAAVMQELFGGDDGSDAAKAASDAARTQANIAQDQWDYYKKNYEPVNTALINEAMVAGSPEDIARAEGRANAANTAAFNRAQKEYQSRMQSYGINPSAPAYQSGVGSVGLAEAASGVGARTVAGDTARNLGWTKKFDVANMGKGIPSQSSTMLSQAANAGLNSANVLSRQNATNVTNAGYGLEPIKSYLTKNAADWFDQPSRTWNNDDPNWGSGWKQSGDYFGGTIRYKKGGMITPHMKRSPARYALGGLVAKYANGGAVIDNETGEVSGPGDGTSDSVEAEIDGEQPAALSSGEFVMNAEVPKLTGEEILTAINDAGLRKRGDTAEPQAEMPMRMKRGGRVNRSCYGL